MTKRNLRYVFIIILFCLSLFIFTALLGFAWMKALFGAVSLEQILFHLSFPLEGADTKVIRSFILKVIIPSLLLSVFMTSPYKSIQFSLKYLSLFIRWCKKYFLYLRFRYALCALLLIAVCIIAERRLSISTFVVNAAQKQYSQFYEQYYVAPQPIHTDTPNNLIVIFSESLESTFSSKYGGGEYPEFIPHLSELALSNTYFSDTETFGGITQVANTGWTIAGLVSYLCAVPLHLPIDGNSFNNTHFLDSAVCVSDILSGLGYTQLMLIGSDAKFAGRGHFFSTHKIPYKDLISYKKEQKIPKNYNVHWGFEDSKLFAFAKEELENLYQANTPFALYILTTDTHFPDGFVDSTFCPDLQDGYRNAVQCSDRIIKDFIDYAQNLTKSYEQPTTIVVLGDHLSMKQGLFPPHSKRRIYNTFINASFSITPTDDLLYRRNLSHFDMTPLLLDSLGMNVQAFGLGRNPLYSKTLLETFGLESFNKHLTQPSRFYEDLWRTK